MKYLRLSVFVLAALFLYSDGFAQGKPISLLKGELLDQNGGKVAGVSIAVFKEHEKVITTKSTPEGKFQGILPGAGVYRIAIKSDKYFFVEDTINLASLESYRETPYHRQLTPLVSGASLPISGKVFDYGSSKLNASSEAELSGWALAAKQNPQLSYEITVFPDLDIRNIKKDAAQLKLVKSRAQEIQSFFVGKGISVNVSTSNDRSSLSPRFGETVKISKKKSEMRQEPQKLLIITVVR